MRAFDRDLIRGGHYGQRSCEPRKQAEHMAATDQLHREENPCQQGAVHTWHNADLTTLIHEVCLPIQSGRIAASLGGPPRARSGRQAIPSRRRQDTAALAELTGLARDKSASYAHSLESYANKPRRGSGACCTQERAWHYRHRQCGCCAPQPTRNEGHACTTGTTHVGVRDHNGRRRRRFIGRRHQCRG